MEKVQQKATVILMPIAMPRRLVEDKPATGSTRVLQQADAHNVAEIHNFWTWQS